MRIVLRLDFVNGTNKDVVASAPDLVAFEREFDLSVASLGGNPKFSHLLWLAWHSEKRRKETSKEFDVWLEEVDSVGGSDTDPK
jgi:hypothetical protein